jgi:hypothetical protein
LRGAASLGGLAGKDPSTGWWPVACQHRRAHASCPSRVDVRRVAAAFTSPCCAAVASVSPVSFRPAAWRARHPVVQAPPVPSFVRVHRIVVVLPAAPASP